MTMTPVTRGPYFSGTASSDSSISAVPAICSPNSWSRGVADEERLAGLGDAAR